MEFELGVDTGVRFTLGKQPAEPRQVSHAMHRISRREKARGAQVQAFDRIEAKMLIKPRPPCGAQRIAGLQHTTQPRAGPAPHQAQMPATLRCHQFENDTGLAVAFDAEHNAFVSPLHRQYLIRLRSSAKAVVHSLGNCSPISR